MTTTLSEFQLFALSPAVWAWHAKALKRSADLLWAPMQEYYDLFAAAAASDTAPRDQPEFDLTAPHHALAYLMVAGAAVETMLKAAAVQRTLNEQGATGVLAPNGSALRGWLTTHNLNALAVRANVTVKPGHEVFLKRFSDWIRWAGRYPTDKAFRTSKPSEIELTNYLSSNTDHIYVERYFAEAQRAYEEAFANRVGAQGQ